MNGALATRSDEQATLPQFPSVEFEVISRPDGAALMFVEKLSSKDEPAPMMLEMEGEYYLVFEDRRYHLPSMEESLVYITAPAVSIIEVDSDSNTHRIYGVELP